MGDSLRLCVSILNFRTPDLTLECLETVVSQVDPSRDRIFVLDNFSEDASCDRISAGISQRGWGDRVELRSSPRNRGFSGGHNQIVAAIPARWYLLLNSDTLVRPGAIEALLQAVETNPSAGVVSSRLESANGAPHVNCFRFPTPMSEMLWSSGSGPLVRMLEQHSVPQPGRTTVSKPDWTSFACVVIPRAVTEAVGLLDDRYFMYFEDVDYCRRVRQAGMEVLHWPDARVVHKRAASVEEPEDTTRAHLPRSYFASRSLYFVKHHGRIGLVCANLFWTIGRAVSLLREWFGGKEKHTARGEGHAIWTNWRKPREAAQEPTARRKDA